MPVYDVTYRRGIGALRRGPRWWPIYRESIKHSWRNIWMRLFLLAAFFPALVGLFLFAQASKIFPEIARFTARFDLSLYSEFWSWTNPTLILLAAGTGAGLISEDRKVNALEIYFSRAIYRRDYLIGKILGMLTVMLFASTVPLVLLWVFHCGLSEAEHPWTGREHYPLLFLLNGLAVSVPMTLVVLAISSFAKGSANAIIYWIALAFFTILPAQVLARGVLQDRRGALSSFIYTLDGIRYGIFDISPSRHRFYDVPPFEPAVILMSIVCLVSLLVLIRRTQPTEIVS